MKIHKLNINLVGFCMIVLLVCGCSSDCDTKTSYLTGYVAAKTDITAAGIQVTDVDGNVIAEKDAPATSDYGAFMISVQDLPYEFRVVSSGGTEWGEDVDYKLMGRFEAFDQDNDTIYLNFVTTLVCLYLDRNPGMSLAEATDAVKAFLDIPAEVDIGEGLHLNDAYFSSVEFKKEAPGGDVELFMETLVDEIVVGSVENHSFPPSSLLSGPAGAVLLECGGTSMSQAARNGVIAWGVGKALGIGMEQMGLGDVFSSGGPTTEDIAEMKQMLRDIQGQLNNLNSLVAASTAEIKAEISKAQYNLASMSMSDFVETVKYLFKMVTLELLKDPDQLTAIEITQRANNLKDYLQRIRNKISGENLSIFHAKILGTAPDYNNGILQMYADKVKGEKRFLTKNSYQDKVKNLFLYYNQIWAMALCLTLEYDRAGSPIDGIGPLGQARAMSDIDIVNNGSQAEMAWINSVDPIPEGHYFFPGKMLMIYAPDNFYELMIPDQPQYSRPCYFNVNVKYSGGMTAMSWRGILRIMKMNWDSMFGFNNWRNPKGDEVNAMFAGWSTSSSSPGAFAKSQGLASMDVERYIHSFYEPSTCWDDINCEFDWLSGEGTCGPSVTDYSFFHCCTTYTDPDYGSWYFQTTDGQWGWTSWNSGVNLNFMPVRQIMSNERYVW